MQFQAKPVQWNCSRRDGGRKGKEWGRRDGGVEGRREGGRDIPSSQSHFTLRYSQLNVGIPGTHPHASYTRMNSVCIWTSWRKLAYSKLAALIQRQATTSELSEASVRVFRHVTAVDSSSQCTSYPEAWGKETQTSLFQLRFCLHSKVFLLPVCTLQKLEVVETG